MIASEQVSSYLNRLASNAPTPGGGAVGALHVAQGAALVSMVANFTIGGKFADVEEQAQRIANEAKQIIEQALQAADDDERLFGNLIAAYKMPKQTDAEKKQRTAMIQSTTVEATAPQVATVELSSQVIAQAQQLLVIGNQSVISDVAAAAAAAKAALETALVTLEMNIEAIKEAGIQKQLIECAKRAQNLIEKAQKIIEAVRDDVKGAQKLETEHQILSGKPVAAKLLSRVQNHTEQLLQHNVVPRLAVILATDNDATVWYVKSIQKAAHAQGLQCDVHELKEPNEGDLKTLIHTLNQDANVHGIILQTPLPQGMDHNALINLIDVEKDIDGANPLSLGRLSGGQKAFAPATARSVMEILDYYGVVLAGEEVTVIGRSSVVGKPLMQLLLKKNATVTLCHSHTKNLLQHTQAAKIVIVAVGQINLLKQTDITPESIVIDVGTNIGEDGKLTGDVAREVANVARALTPVPGGVGTVTTTLLLLHTVEAALNLTKINE